MGGGAAGQRGRGAAALIVALVCIPMLLAGQDKISDKRPANPDVALRIYWPSGTLRVTAWAKDTVAVSGYVDPTLGRFFIGGVSSALKLGVDAPETASTEGSAVLDVSVPAGARVWIKSVTGDIEVNDVTGTVEVFTVGGQLRVSGNPSVVTAESMDGNIELAVQSPDATARTASGTIVFRGVIRNATASSISGPLFIGMEGKISRARFETVSGEIAFKGDLDPDGSLEAESHSGDIELRLPEGLGATYDLAAYSGPVSSELQALGPPVRKGEWRMIVGDGRAHVAVRTFKGKVEVKKRGER